MKLPEVGDRIELVAMPDDPDPIEAGAQGTVEHVEPACDQIIVNWDNGRKLNLVISVDRWRLLPEEGAK